MTGSLDLGGAAAVRPPRLSDVLRDLEGGLGPRISLGDLVARLRERSFAPLMVLLAAPNVFLFVPGSSAITGLPLMLIALQLMRGRQAVRLPKALSDRSLDRASFARIVRFSLKWVERIERQARPRFWPGGTYGVHRAVGVAALAMAILLFLPIPFGNAVPALAIIALGLALSERDGVWLITGFVAAVLAIVIVAAVLGGSALALAQFL